jgi:hypothetical protein
LFFVFCLSNHRKCCFPFKTDSCPGLTAILPLWQISLSYLSPSNIAFRSRLGGSVYTYVFFVRFRSLVRFCWGWIVLFWEHFPAKNLKHRTAKLGWVYQTCKWKLAEFIRRVNGSLDEFLIYSSLWRSFVHFCAVSVAPQHLAERHSANWLSDDTGQRGPLLSNVSWPYITKFCNKLECFPWHVFTAFMVNARSLS